MGDVAIYNAGFVHCRTGSLESVVNVAVVT